MTARLACRPFVPAVFLGIVIVVALATNDGYAASAPLARQILDASGTAGGLVVHVGCRDGCLTAELAAALAESSSLSLESGGGRLVHGLDTSEENVREAREYLQSLGVYGPVSVERFDGKALPYAKNLVNLVVTEDLGELPMAEVMRVLCPGGVAYIKNNDHWMKKIKPRPNNIDDWTHYLHDATGNAVASDTAVGPPDRFQWIAEPRWARSHDHLSSLSALVSAGGRIFCIIDEGSTASVAIEPRWSLVARDAFSGVLLWKRPISSWEGHLRSFRSGPAELARRLVAVGDHVYVTLGYGEPVSVLDAATGKTIRKCDQTAGALEFIYHNDMLLVVVGDRVPDNTDGAAKPVNPENIWHWWPIYEDTPPRKHLVAVWANTGAVSWKKKDADTVELMPTALAASGSRVFFQNHEALLALDASSGREIWRAARPINRDRPSWSAPTLVVYRDIVLCADRAVDATPPGVPEIDKPSRWVVNSHGGIAPEGQIVAFAADSGKPLWESKCRECYNSPVDVLVADGLVWSGDLVLRGGPGITAGLDIRTGEAKRLRPADQKFFKIGMGHHRCYRNKATEKYLVLGRDGIEFINLATGQGLAHAWVRGSCQYGVMPSNGLIYAPPHSCACHIESKLNGFNALAPASSEDDPPPSATSDDRLQRGPAYDKISKQQQPVDADKTAEAVVSDEWPTYRHNPLRSGRSSCKVPATLEKTWTAKLPAGRLSSPVIADGKVFVASVDAHVVRALNAKNGELLWTFTAGGRVDSPPTIHRGTAIFGSADGWIYCLDIDDGRLAWRFHAALLDRRIVCRGQIESAWPVHGSVLVLDNTIHAVAGRTSYLDGGLFLYRLDARSGKVLSMTPIPKDGLPDVLSSDGTSVFLRHKRFDIEGIEQQQLAPHLYSPAGFLDDSWWHRTYWLFGTRMGSGWGSWPNSGAKVPAGRIMVLGGSDVYGFGRFNQYHRDGTHVGLGKARYWLYASSNTPAVPAKGTPRKGPPANKAPANKAPAANKSPAGVASRWSRPLPILARGMVLSDNILFVAGPPNVLTFAPEETTDPYHSNSANALREQEAALAGQRGGRLLAVSTADGKTRAEYELDAPPEWDALAAASGRLFLTTTDGKVLCFGQPQKSPEK